MTVATFTKVPLSGSTGGRGVPVAATATPGTTIHTGSSGTDLHELWIYATNTDVVARKLTIEWGGVTVPGDVIELMIAPEAGLILVIPGLALAANATPPVVGAFADVTSVVTIHGYVNVIGAEPSA